MYRHQVTSGAGHEKTPEEIEREMSATRDSMVEKVAALEHQVLGTVQSAADTITGTVEAVKNFVSHTPETVSDTVKHTVSAVSDAVKEKLDVTRQVQQNPWAAVGIAAGAGFLIGMLIPGGRTASVPRRMAKASAPVDHSFPPTPASHAYQPPREPGMFDELWDRVRDEVGAMARDVLQTASASLRQTLHDEVPKLVETAVHTGTDQIHNRLHNGRHYSQTGA
jgi:ElaB/YqjD/DUF883 family membrane-anchored ribosome-binding protein